MFDVTLTTLEVLKMPDFEFVLDGGLIMSTHDLVKRGYVIRLRRKYRSCGRVNVTMKNGNSNITVAVQSKFDDIEYVLGHLNEDRPPTLTHKHIVHSLGYWTDSQLLSELRKRNPFKPPKKETNNVVDLKEYLKENFSEYEQQQSA